MEQPAVKTRAILLFVAMICTAAAIARLAFPTPDGSSPTELEPVEYDPEAAEPQARLPAPRSGLINPTAIQPRTDDPIDPDGTDSDLLLDAAGHLVKDVRLRDVIERLLSSNPGNLEQSKQDLINRLPPAAAQQMLEMVERFVNYRAALQQALPQSPQAMSEQDALTLLQTVSALRLAYFGPELTESFFGAEETLSRD